MFHRRGKGREDKYLPEKVGMLHVICICANPLNVVKEKQKYQQEHMMEL